jgi:hypothetical protein
MEKVQHGVPKGSVLRLLLFLIYINDLSKSISDKCSPFLFADETSFIIANPNELEFKFNIETFTEISKWFQRNLLMMNYDKTYFLQSITKTDHEINMQVSFGNKKIAAAQTLKFLGLTIDTPLTWEYHICELTSRLNKACYAMRLIKPFMSVDLLRSAYFSYAHSIISYVITSIFWGNSSHSDEVFKTQKRMVRIIMNSSRNASCRQLFKELQILSVQSQHIFSVLSFVIQNKDQFLFNSQVHKIYTRQPSNLYLPSANLKYARRVFITQE